MAIKSGNKYENIFWMTVRISSGITEKGASTLNIKDIVPHAILQTE